MSHDDTHRPALLERAYRRIIWRLVPFLVALFILAWLDRVNVGFAKLQMLDDLGFSEAVYGLGAGIFFVGYFLFEVPSNLLLERIGARRTLARITICWGLISTAMFLVTTPTQFYVLRFLLGVFEAGFFPGVVLYLTYWFPTARRARVNGLFMTSFALAGVVGGPLAGLIMERMADIGGLAGWQWLFIVEGVPSVLAGLAVLRYLPERPADVGWLSEAERALVSAEVARDAAVPGKAFRLRDAFLNPHLWLCAAIYFCLVSGNATIAFWMPTLIRELGVEGNLRIGLLAALPFAVGTLAMVLNGIHSDRSGERRLHCAGAAALAGVGLAACAALMGHGVAAMLALTLAAVGILAAFPVFWSLPTLFLTGTAAAGGIAVINSIGNLAGFAAPYLIGWVKDRTGALAGGLYVVAGLELLAAVLVMVFIRKARRG
ncbi:MFS transporter [Pseudomonas tohonis]|uniref:MFS transporter n=1 Tax=Pseudomonas tohonis TaxID=2725477 RepID=UPI0022F07087|nr:MFS transporter [Pseudomonas tohonis]